VTWPAEFDSKWMIEEMGPLPGVSPVMTIEYVPAASPGGRVASKVALPDASTVVRARTTFPGTSETVTAEDGASPRGLMETVDPAMLWPGCMVVDICISRGWVEPSVARSSPEGMICAGPAEVGADGAGPFGTVVTAAPSGMVVDVVVDVVAPDAAMVTGDAVVWPCRAAGVAAAAGATTGADAAGGALAVATVVVVADVPTAGDVVVDVGMVVDVVDVVDVVLDVVVVAATST
jgi:hypothetical protein